MLAEAGTAWQRQRLSQQRQSRELTTRPRPRPRPQEPRKSDAPQLRDEYRTYKILAGSRESCSDRRLNRG